MTTHTQTDFDAISDWHHAMADRGILQATTVRLRLTALSALMSVMGEDEPKDAKSIRDMIEELASRWTLKNSANPETSATYATRARGALDDFMAYRADPLKFKAKTRTPKPPAVKAKAPDAPAVAPTPTSAPTPVTSAPAMRTFPVSTGGEMMWGAPSEGFTTDDAMRFLWHILPMARDFDPRQGTARMLKLPQGDSDPN